MKQSRAVKLAVASLRFARNDRTCAPPVNESVFSMLAKGTRMGDLPSLFTRRDTCSHGHQRGATPPSGVYQLERDD